ncbi:MAG: 2-oxoglutarate and iron-dependent oxygenase domain-containing protein [Pseudomonadota bacterium]|nr:2-oxoglutarate and iron-dependent oxygenase domain-containing protein [Pseudomonadota bacterium]
MIDKIPIIDLSRYSYDDESSLESFAEKIAYVQTKIGFYTVINHGIPKKIIDDAYSELKLFFKLPLDQKLSLRINDKSSGYIPAKSTVYVTSRYNKNTKPDLNETFTLAREREENDILIKQGLRFMGPNQWPVGLKRFKAKMLEYQSQLSNFALKLLPIYARALGLDKDYFSEYFTNPLWWTRNSYYPAVDYEANQFGISPHSDHSFMTLLPMSDVPGLQVLSTDKKWIPVDPVNNGIVINTGEFLNRWSNGKFLATPHRVIPPIKDRYSMAMFFNPNPDTISNPFPSCVGKKNLSKFKPISMYDYMCWYIDSNYKTAGGGKQN